MSQDSCIHGINKLKKPATKVMAPPGGRTGINIFGGDTPAPPTPVNENQRKRNDSSVFGAPVVDNNITSTKVNTDVVDNSAPSFGSNANEGVRPSTKVMAPPGGKTSINLFG